nr:MAG TPA: hypothetical protein [Caudoviricetes sp.]
MRQSEKPERVCTGGLVRHGGFGDSRHTWG